MKKEKYMNWDTYFMSVALLSSFRSKDKITQNGACIIDANKKII
jgi:dCMP deaminase